MATLVQRILFTALKGMLNFTASQFDRHIPVNFIQVIEKQT